MPNIVLFNTGWMKHYQGQTDHDIICNGGKYVTDNHTGGEVWNFKPIDGICYGYVRVGRKDALNLSRIGSFNIDKQTDYLGNITVVWTATPREGTRRVVGWYRNARVWRHLQNVKRESYKGYGYLVEAGESDCTLLPADERTFRVPRARKGVWGMGQSHVRYLDEDTAASFRTKLIEYISDPNNTKINTPRGSKRSGLQSDPELRYRVEQTAVKYVKAHYKSKGFICKSVERDNVGWDLEVSKGCVKKLLVEVKGCSGATPSVEVTPNEYQQMNDNLDSYRLAIVTNALNKRKAVLSIVSYNFADETWRDEDDRIAKIKEHTAARIDLPTS